MSNNTLLSASQAFAYVKARGWPKGRTSFYKALKETEIAAIRVGSRFVISQRSLDLLPTHEEIIQTQSVEE